MITNYSPKANEWKLLKEFEINIAAQDIELEALIYITGYVAHRFRHKYTMLGCATKVMPPCDNWLSFISRGNCIYPSAEFLAVAEVMNTEFKLFHGDFFNLEDKIFDRLTHRVHSKIANNFPMEVIACLVRTRTYIRLKRINNEIKINNIKPKKKLKHMCNITS